MATVRTATSRTRIGSVPARIAHRVRRLVLRLPTGGRGDPNSIVSGQHRLNYRETLLSNLKFDGYSILVLAASDIAFGRQLLQQSGPFAKADGLSLVTPALAIAAACLRPHSALAVLRLLSQGPHWTQR